MHSKLTRRKNLPTSYVYLRNYVSGAVMALLADGLLLAMWHLILHHADPSGQYVPKYMDIIVLCMLAVSFLATFYYIPSKGLSIGGYYSMQLSIVIYLHHGMGVGILVFGIILILVSMGISLRLVVWQHGSSREHHYNVEGSACSEDSLMSPLIV
mmetsp:Transcript_24156/g.50597  ORF Transcript_24156/g.50597 Transcript_24156/m.50597 type:complete len:155 (+) Transcript_24156:327-791(+)